MEKKRAIDRKLDAALTIELCDAVDKTPIRELLSVAGNLYTITDKSIFLTVKLNKGTKTAIEYCFRL